MYRKVIRAALVCYASKLLGRLQRSHDNREIGVLARELACICRILNFIDNGEL